MAVHNLPNYDYSKHGFSMPLNMARANAFPLDKSSVWETKAAALNYAKTDPVAYVGQIITVVNHTPAVMEGDTVKTPESASVDVYKIVLNAQGEGDLVKIGTEQLEADLSNINTQLDGIVANYTTLSATVETVKGTADTAAAQAQANAGALETLSGTVQTQGAAIEAAAGQAETNKTAIADLVEADKGINAKINKLETDSATHATITQVATAKQEAIDAAKDAILGYLAEEEVNASYDTLKEVAAWIESDTTNSAELIERVSAIEEAYVTKTEKAVIDEAIANLDNFVGKLPEGTTSTTVVGYIQDMIAGLKIGDYAKAADLTALAGTVSTLGETVSGHSTKFVEIEATIKQQNDKITAVETAVETTVNEALSGKVDKQETDGRAHRLLSPSEQDILSNLKLESDGSVTTGQTVTAGKVEGLAQWITDNAPAALAGKIGTTQLADEVKTLLNGNIKQIKIDGTALTLDSTSAVDIPLATLNNYGVVKLGSEFKLNTEGAMEINSLNVNKLVQDENDWLELNGGNAALTWN